MALLARLESALSAVIEGCSSRLLGGRLSRRQLVAAAAAAVERQRLADGTEVATNYVLLRLNPADQDALAGELQDLGAQAGQRLREVIAGHGWALAGRPQVSVRADAAVPVGRVEAQASVVPGPGPARLVPPRGEPFDLPTRPQVIGRDPGCDIRLEYDGVSRRHARVEPAADHFVISDLGSTNGTLVNGGRVSRQPLKHGQVVQIGPVRLAYEEL